MRNKFFADLITTIEKNFKAGRDVILSKVEYTLISILIMITGLILMLIAHSGLATFLFIISFVIAVCFIGKGVHPECKEKYQDKNPAKLWRCNYFIVLMACVLLIMSIFKSGPHREVYFINANTGVVSRVNSVGEFNSELAQNNLTKLIKSAFTITDNKLVDDIERTKAQAMLSGDMTEKFMADPYRDLSYKKDITNTVSINSITNLKGNKYLVSWTEILINKTDKKEPVITKRSAIFTVDFGLGRNSNFHVTNIDELKDKGAK